MMIFGFVFPSAMYVALAACLFIATWISSNTPKLGVPLALSDEYSPKKRIQYYTFNSKQALVKSYRKFKDEVFGLQTTEGINCVIPREYLDNLKSHKALSFEATLNDTAQTRYTSVGGLPDFAVKLLTGKLNPTLNAYTPIIHQMVRNGWLQCFREQNTDWTETKVYPNMLHLVAKMSARIFHSSDASNNERWVQLSMEYVRDVVPFAQQLKSWPKFLRPLVSRYIPGAETLRVQRNEIRKIIADTLQKKKAGGEAGLESPPSMLDYLSSGKHSNLIEDIDQQFFLQMTLIVASVHTSAATLTQSLFDMAIYRGFLPELRDEVRTVLEECGGVFTRDGISRLKKLDSFIKEVQRFNSPDLTTFQRIALSPLALPNGLHIPKGTKLELATAALNLDDDIWGDASTFDGFRFYKLRQQSVEDEQKYQFVSVSKKELAWGYGRHACPGRWLADIVIKIILAEFLLRHDIKNPDGKGRWKSLEIDGQILPNEEGEVLMRTL